MPTKNNTASQYNLPWYAVSANRLVGTLGALKREVNCDICIVGAGFTGISAGLELARRGFSVIILEKTSLAAGPSGRNGGQLQRGFAKGAAYMIDKYGVEDSKVMCDVTMEGIKLIHTRIKEFDIKCDWRPGVVTAATQDSHIKELAQERDAWLKLGHDDLELLDRETTQDIVHVRAYTGALYDPAGGHIHPYNYGLGIAHGAQELGVKFYDNTPALSVTLGDRPRVTTPDGAVNARFVFLAGGVRLKGAEEMVKRSITATAHMIATEPMGEGMAKSIMSRNVAVCDARFIMDYYRLSSDYRMLFGGNCNYSDMDYPGEDMRLRGRMLKIFPQLRDLKIEHCWHGPLEFTINRMPGLGRLSPTVYYAHGFGGQGVVATNILGAVVAEAIAGHANRFDVFAKVKHQNFPGGNWLKQPLFALGMWWYQLRDALS